MLVGAGNVEAPLLFAGAAAGETKSESICGFQPLPE